MNAIIPVKHAICINRVIKLTGRVNPMTRLIISEMCKQGFLTPEIAAFVNELLKGEDSGNSVKTASDIFSSVLQKNKAKLKIDLAKLAQEYQKLWSDITDWVKIEYPDVAVEMIKEMREWRPAFNSLDQAKSWAKKWYALRYTQSSSRRPTKP